MLSAKKELFTPSGGGYQISRSVRLRSSASAYFNRTQTTTTNSVKCTWSGWVKRGNLGILQNIITGSNGTDADTMLYFAANDKLTFYSRITNTNGAPAEFSGESAAVFRDASAWYHIVLRVDTSTAQATNNDYYTVYVNGVAQTFTNTSGANLVSAATVQNRNTCLNVSGYPNRIGVYRASSGYLDGYLTEINFIDGQALTPSSFGETNSQTGVWQPKRYAGTYGTNGFYLNFSDNSAATATTIGKDYSGNGNNWTPNNISVTAGVTYDSMLDVPTPYADRGNYAVGNPLAVNVTTSATATLTNGNLLLTNGSATYSGFPSTMSIPVTGKWAWKFKVTGSVSGSNEGYIGFACNSSGNPVTGASSGAAANWYTTVQVQAVSDRGVVHKYAGGSVVTDAAGSGGTGATGDEWEFLIDRDAGTTIVKVNGTTKATVTGLPATQELFPFATFYQTSGYFIFDYTPSDTSYKTLNTQNLPASTISNGANYMAATLYTGNGSTQSLTNTVNGISFQPDLVWVKARSLAYSNYLYDSVRGTGTSKSLISDATAAEGAGSANANLTSFDASGFSLGTTSGVNGMNANAGTFVGWQWNAGGSTVTNTSGSISAQVRANPTAGFSVVTYTGNGTSGATVGHGLGAAPKMIIVKRRDASTNWPVWHTSVSSGTSEFVQLNLTTAKVSDATFFTTTAPTSSVFSLGTGSGQTNTGSMVAYCFSEVAGYSAFGSYTGNGSTDGPFVYLGFEPRWVMIKQTNTTGDWQMYDTSRAPINVASNTLYANGAFAEDSNTTNRALDLLSNGFKLRSSASFLNASGGTYVYACFAESPFKLSLAR